MGKIGGASLLMALKNVFRSPSESNNEKQSPKRREDQNQGYSEEKKRTKRRWIFQKPSHYETTIRHHVARSITLADHLVNCVSPEVLKCQQEPTIPLAIATTKAAERPIATAPQVSVLKQHAATVIQTAFRGYLSRRALAALRGIVKLQAWIRGHNVRMQANITLHCMQALIRVQTLVCGQRQSLLHGKSNANCIQDSNGMGKNFTCAQVITSEDVDGDEEYLAKKIHELLQKTKEAASRCENYLAYAFSQQMLRSGDDQTSAKVEKHEENLGRKHNKQRAQIITASYDEKEYIKTVEIDTIQPCTYSSHTFGRSQAFNHQDRQEARPSSYTGTSPLKREHHSAPAQSPTRKFPRKIQPVQVHSGNQEERSYSMSGIPTTGLRFFHGVKEGEQCVAAAHAKPKYMEATAAASARARSLGTPRQRPLTPERDRNASPRKLLPSPVMTFSSCPVATRESRWLK